MSQSIYSLSSYQYELPESLIAQHPCSPRDHSRLMVIDRGKGQISEMVFRDLADWMNKGDSLIFNDTKVIPARLLGRKESGAQVEIFLLRYLEKDSWEAMGKPGRRLHPGTKIIFGADFVCEILETRPNGTKVIKFHYEGHFESLLQKYGKIPLPHYLQRAPLQQDEDQYQTIYATQPGAVAAPTAGLHFTADMLERLRKKEIDVATLTLHVGLGTFRPVQTEDIRDHHMHTEFFRITPETAEFLHHHSPSQRQICVGTTTCRALESVYARHSFIRPGDYETDIFIYPGYSFRYVRSLLTNFHLPGSSLLMLVCAFAGHELIMEAYAKAVKEKFRFFSYGDAMLII